MNKINTLQNLHTSQEPLQLTVLHRDTLRIVPLTLSAFLGICVVALLDTLILLLSIDIVYYVYM